MKIPKFDAEQLSEAEDLDKTEYYEFLWQQKIFNSYEIDHYGKLENCRTDIEKSYHDKIVNESKHSNDETKISKRIFSCVSGDKYVPKDDDEAVYRSNWKKLAQFIETENESQETVDSEHEGEG